MKEKTKKRLKGLFEFFKITGGGLCGASAYQLINKVLSQSFKAADNLTGANKIVTKIVIKAGVVGISTAVGIATTKAIDEGLSAIETAINNVSCAKDISLKFKTIDILVDTAIKAGVEPDKLREFCDKIGEAKNMKNPDGLIEYLDALISELKSEIAGVSYDDSEEEDKDNA